jgi:Flp pilus assembly protein TadD
VLLRRALTWLEAGDMTAAQADIDACTRANQRIRLPEVDVHLRWWTAMRTGLAGDPDAAARLCRQAYEVYRQTVWGSEAALTAQLASTLLDRGQYQDAEKMLRSHDEPTSPVTAEHLGLILAKQGSIADARRICLPAERLAEPPRDWLWLMQMVLRAYTWALCGDIPSSEYALQRLLRYSGRTVTTGSAILCWGSIDHFLGESAAVTGQTELAITLLRKAARHNDEMGCVIWRDRSAARLAELTAG